MLFYKYLRLFIGWACTRTLPVHDIASFYLISDTSLILLLVFVTKKVKEILHPFNNGNENQDIKHGYSKTDLINKIM